MNHVFRAGYVGMAVLGLLLVPALAQQQTNSLDSLRETYEKADARITAVSLQRTQEALESYGTALSAAMKAAQGRGDLDAYSAIEAEKQRFGGDRVVPTNAVPEALHGSVQSYHVAVAAEKSSAATQRMALLKKYVGSLDMLVKRLTKEGQIPEAKNAKDRKSAAEFELAEMEAKIGSTAAGTAEGPKAPAPRLPMEFKGRFYVSVDDGATIYIKGRNVYQAPIGESASGEVALRLNDVITVQLVNVGGPRHFTMAFRTLDEEFVIAFQQANYRLLQDPKKRNLTAMDVARLKDQPSKEINPQGTPFPFSASSDWVWGQGDNCWLAIPVTKDMIQAQP